MLPEPQQLLQLLVSRARTASRDTCDKKDKIGDGAAGALASRREARGTCPSTGPPGRRGAGAEGLRSRVRDDQG